MTDHDAQSGVRGGEPAGVEPDAVAELRAILAHAHDIIVRVDRDGVIRYINRVLSPWTVEHAVGRSWLDYVPAAGRARADAAFRAVIARGRPATIEHEIERLGAPGIYSTLIAPIDQGGIVVGAVMIGRDITERREEDARLRVADRMATIGTLSAGLAHEVNNPLAAVVANLAVAQREAAALGGAAELHRALGEACDAAARVRDIIRDLAMFARAEDASRRAVDVRDVVEATLRLARNELRHRARLVHDLDDLPPVVCNAARLGQVFLNLLVNAAQAIPEGHADEHEVRVVARHEAGRVIVAVTDTGAGMTDEIQRRLFVPFFTTRPPGEGTGLGLPIAQQIVTALGGEIRVRSAPGAGSTFTVILPAAGGGAPDLAAAPAPAVAAARRPAPAPSPHRARVLVIDDEVMITTVIRRVLGRDHDVVTENAASAALARIDAGERFDLILCDLMMPEVTGMDFYEAVGARAPAQQARITFITGGAFTPRAREFLDRVPNPWIEKPFTPADLFGAVAARLAAPADG